MEEEAREGLSLPSPNLNYGIHSDPVWGSSHAPTLIHKHLCCSFPHLHWFRCVEWGEGRGGEKGAPLWLKLVIGLLGNHKNLRSMSSQQALLPWVKVKPLAQGRGSDLQGISEHTSMSFSWRLRLAVG